MPGGAAVGRLVDSTTGAVGGRVREPRRAARIPESGVHHTRIGRVDDDLDRTDVLVLIEDLLPGATAVARTEHAAVRVRRIEVADCRDEDNVGVLGIYGDLADV